ncbi:ABC transporter permease [Acidobacteriota bacterium]
MKKVIQGPPILAEWILSHLSREQDKESVVQDFQDIFEIRVLREGRGQALRWYWAQIFKSTPKFLVNRLSWRLVMFRNYFKIAYRNLIKHRAYSLINIFGLSFGIVCCILILAYIGYEFSFDGYHKNKDNIYRVVLTSRTSGRTSESLGTPPMLAPTMISDFPEVLDAVRISPTVRRVFKYKDNVFFQEGVLYVDHSVLDVFSWKLLKGDPETALKLPYTMLLTETTAQKYFGNEDPVGKIIFWDNSTDYTVTGVIEDPPVHSHFTFEALASLATYFKYDSRLETSWNSFYCRTYLLLREGTDVVQLDEKIAGFNDHFLGEILRERGQELETRLQPLKNIHLGSNYGGELGVNSDIRIIYAFSAIALVILIIACINFMNLSTARATTRAREVGLRKVLGAVRRGLIYQFIGESFFFALLSVMLAMILTPLVLPYFRNLADRPIVLDFLGMPHLAFGLVGIIIFISFVAGSYPAFFLSSFRPVKVLKGDLRTGSKRSLFRSILVILQFAVSTVLIIGTFVIFNQQRYMRTKDLGFEKTDLLVLTVQNEMVRAGLDSFQNEIERIQGVKGSGASSMVPGEFYLFNSPAIPEGFSSDQRIQMDNFFIDPDFVDIMGMKIIQGRGFSHAIPADKHESVLINETAVRRFELSDPLGKTIEISSPNMPNPIKKRVVGVFRDIHQRSLYSTVSPTFLQHILMEGPIENRARRLVVRLETEDLPHTLSLVENKWKDVFPNEPYYAFFLDEFYDGQYRAEERLGGLFRLFSILAILIGSVGLFGLVSFMTETRTKEIGIRKAIGSPVGSIVYMLCRKFIILVFIANTIAWPIAFLAARRWLQDFPYPVSLGMGTFILTTLLTVIIALFSVGYKSYQAARANPIDSLRYE